MIRQNTVKGLKGSSVLIHKKEGILFTFPVPPLSQYRKSFQPAQGRRGALNMKLHLHAFLQSTVVINKQNKKIITINYTFETMLDFQLFSVATCMLNPAP